MLTGKMIRVRQSRDRLIPLYLDVADAEWNAVAERLLELFRPRQGCSRGELEEEIEETFGHLPNPLVYQGLAKLLEDRCEFEVVSGHPPEELREAVFAAAARRRQNSMVGQERGSPETTGAPTLPLSPTPTPTFNRHEVLQEVASNLGVEPAVVDQGLFADLKSEQRLIRFKETTGQRLLQRYNVALAQAVLLKAVAVQVEIRQEAPARYRQLLRLAKFHRLVWEAEALDAGGFRLRLDGPLSLFSATSKYGLQLALFLPALLHCRDFEIRADLRWGPQRKPRTFRIDPQDGLVSHAPDTGMYVPAELAMFADLFRKKVPDWEITEETALLTLGKSFWVPDYRLRHRSSGREVYLDVLGYWRRSSFERHLELLRQHARHPFVLAISQQLKVDDAEWEGLPAGIHRFRHMPLPEEIARLADLTAGQTTS